MLLMFPISGTSNRSPRIHISIELLRLHGLADGEAGMGALLQQQHAEALAAEDGGQRGAGDARTEHGNVIHFLFH